MKIIGYLRVSTSAQELNNQRLAILDYAHRNNLQVSQLVEEQVSSRKSIKERGINDVILQMMPGDLLVVSELSRLGRSVGQIIQIVDGLVKNQLKLIAIKENIQLDGKQDILHILNNSATHYHQSGHPQIKLFFCPIILLAKWPS